MRVSLAPPGPATAKSGILLLWLALGLGFLGIVLILRPDVAGLSPTMLLPFAAAACYALAAIVTRSRCGDKTALALALNLHLVLVLAGALALGFLAGFGPSLQVDRDAAAFLVSVWPPLGAAEWGLIGLLGLFMVVIAVAVAKAYQIASTPLIGVFDNAYLAFAALWSALFFDELPGWPGLVGIGLIGGAGAMAVWRRDGEVLVMQEEAARPR